MWGRDRVGGIPEHQRSGCPPRPTPPHNGEGNSRCVCGDGQVSTSPHGGHGERLYHECVGVGAVFASRSVGFGGGRPSDWLSRSSARRIDSGWLQVTYVLVVWLGVVGAIAGRLDRRTRELAERAAAEGDRPSAELARRLRDPVALTLDASMLAATVAIVALMVWKP